MELVRYGECYEVGLFSDGTVVRQVGAETFRLCRRLLDGIMLVDTDEVCAAIRDVFLDTRCVLEPAGALAVAGLKRYAAGLAGEPAALVAVASGANITRAVGLCSAARRRRPAPGARRVLMIAIPVPEASS